MKRGQGFTLAELLIVVAIIAVLVAVAIPVFGGQVEKSKQAVDMANMRAAYAVLLADYLSGDAEAGKTYYFDINSSSMVTSKPSNGYGKSRTEIEGWSLENTTVKGIPNPNGDSPAVLSLMIGANDSVAFQWGGGSIGTWTALSNTTMTLDETTSSNPDWWWAYGDQYKPNRLDALQNMLTSNADNSARVKADQEILQAIADYFDNTTVDKARSILGSSARFRESAKNVNCTLFEYEVDSAGTVKIKNIDTSDQSFLSEIGYTPTVRNLSTDTPSSYQTGYDNYLNQYLFTSDAMVGSVTGNSGNYSHNTTKHQISINFNVEGTGDDAKITGTKVWVSGLPSDISSQYNTATMGN